MLTSHKLLYILPDVAYITELLPTKKEHTFSIQSFRQINGEFIDDNEFIAENIQKLINKIDADEYHLVLPDFLFTNTIVEIAETNETKVKEYLTSKLLPELTLAPDTHELKTFVLTEHGGKSKVQLSALEKSLMNPVSTYAKEKGIKISGVSPLSWTIKSIVSLEPSISIIQMGTHVYLAQHYIGIDQAISAPVTEVVTLSETIKTLKGAEPSIQTVYLITNSVVEEELKENLSGTLPLQQLASFKEEESEMPSYVKYVIEAGMRTFSLEAFPVPRFPLSAPTGEVMTAAKPAETDTSDTDDAPEEKAVEEPTKTEETSPESATTPEPDSLDLPAPSTGGAAVVAGAAAVSPATIATSVTELDLSSSEPAAAAPTPEPEETEPAEEKAIVEPAPTNASTNTETDKTVEQDAEEESEIEEEKIVKTPVIETLDHPKDEEKKPDVIKKEPVITDTKSTQNPKADIIKNQSGIQPMLKMLSISFLVFLITVGLGVGIGRGFIYLAQKQSGGGDVTNPVASTEPTATPEPTPTPTPEPEIDVSELSVLVVNATTKAGYAGKSKTALTDADFKTVDAGNAKGDYEDGFLVLMKEENAALIDKLEEVLDLELTFSDEISVEDPSSKYDAVIVLAE